MAPIETVTSPQDQQHSVQLKELQLQHFLTAIADIVDPENGTSRQIPLSTRHLADEFLGGDHEKTVGLVKSLEARGYLAAEAIERTVWQLTKEGADYVNNGTPERRLWGIVAGAKQGLDLAQVQAALGADVASIGLKGAMKNGWVIIDKGTKQVLPSESSLLDPPMDIVRRQLECLLPQSKQKERIDQLTLNPSDLPEVEETEVVAIMGREMSLLDAPINSESEAILRIIMELKKRKLATCRKAKIFLVSRGDNFNKELHLQQTDLTQEMLQSDSWRSMQFKQYNFLAAGKPAMRGSVHPLMRMMRRLKTALTLMGFEEMATNQWVDSAFWCFDSLFMPQQHPCRDVQDTFFLKDPETSNKAFLPQDHFEAVKKMHEEGGGGSTGWRYQWSERETLKNVLRTHTTASSSRTLQRLAGILKDQRGQFPYRFFSIDRVFRNETLDATHLAEFHQVEGLVADRNITLGKLKGVMTAFYGLIGISPLRFKAAYNPYTEPSMEIFGFHPGLQKWIEVGNSGIFRPEMLLPMGLPADVGVMAWGLSLERPTMIAYGIKNIRELFGHKATLGVV